MSDNINHMDVKQLRNEVQLLRDELAIMKRKYEDIIYNLDTDNFSSRFVKEQGDMRTAIAINAKGIETKVSDAEFQSAMTQTAQKIETEVSSLDENLSSKITQTADEIRQEVEDVASDLSSEISQSARNISLRVNTVEGKTNSISVDGNGIEIDGNRTKIKSVIYLTDDDGVNIATLYCSSQNGRHLYLNSSYNPSGAEIDYIYLGDYMLDYDYDTGTYEDSHNVYVGQETDSWKVATEGWVKKKIAASGGTGSGGDVVAVFG